MNEINENLGDNEISKCTGCRCCEKVCPVNCISIVENMEGFLYPNIDKGKCINCNKCKKYCPVINNITRHKPIYSYASQLRNSEALAASSSGGMFILFARQIIEKGGVVFGCVFNSSFEANIVEATTLEELLPMQGSKYVSSNVLNTYCSTQRYLEQNRSVLYTGTPCQIAGLRAYLGKDYNNLLTMDFLCHGVPSSLIFKDYIKDLEKRLVATVEKYKFRDKGKKGWGIVTSYEYTYKNKKKKKYEVGEINSYFYGFIKGYFNRYSCYTCSFTGTQRISDLTIADYWGVSKFHEQFDTEKGVSLLLLNTEKGVESFESVSEHVIYVASKIENMSCENASLKDSNHIQNIPSVRKHIYEELKTKGYKFIAKKYLVSPKKIKIYIISKIPHKLKSIIKCVNKRG